jgi:hypothetical protein
MKGYQKNSAEARLGALGERWVDAWCTREGGCRLEISMLGKDALIKTPDGRVVSPDAMVTKRCSLGSIGAPTVALIAGSGGVRLGQM